MQPILASLQELDRLYHQDSLEAYEQHWQITAKLVQQAFPGFTIAYAELYNSGISRLSDAAMSHVLVPIAQQHTVTSTSVFLDKLDKMFYFPHNGSSYK